MQNLKFASACSLSMMQDHCDILFGLSWHSRAHAIKYEDIFIIIYNWLDEQYFLMRFRLCHKILELVGAFDNNLSVALFS